MVQRVLKKYPRSIYKEIDKIKQHFNTLLVLDFEATCKRYEPLDPQEVIEIPCAAVSTIDWKIENLFHQYVKPKIHPQLTPFCTELTGIMQEMVDNQPEFPEAFEKFCNWLEEHNYFKEGNECAFVTCGDWDLKFLLPKQCALENIPLPPKFMKWINLKGAFCNATDYYPKSLMDMLMFLKLPMRGRLHSGVNDVENMVRIIQSLHFQYNLQFKINNVSTPILNEYKAAALCQNLV